MRLRRMTDHVHTQNWFALGLDFLIVEIGRLLTIAKGLRSSKHGDDRALIAVKDRMIAGMTP